MGNASRFWLYWERFLPWAVLGLLLVYTYAEIFYMPYIGFNFVLATGEITPVFIQSRPGFDLQEGDRLQQVGAVSWNEYQKEIRQPVFLAVKTGEQLPIQIERHGKPLEILWTIPGPTWWEILDRVINTWWLAYVFWLAGIVTGILVRPKDVRWRLLIAFYFLTAIWLVTGNTSRWRVWESAVILRTAIWLSIPIYLHLHWVFPRPLGKLPAFIWWISYLASFVLVGLQWFQFIPNSLYLYGFMLAFAGSLLLLIAHFIVQPSERHLIRMLLAAFAVAVLPIFVVSIAQVLQESPWFGYITLLSLPLIPGTYLYVTYRYRLGGLEVRANRLIAVYIFLILLSVIVITLVTLTTLLVEFPGKAMFITVVATLLTATVTALWFGSFQQWVEYHLLGIRLPSTQLLQLYAARISASLNLSDLVHMLREDVLPSLLVRQSLLLRVVNANTFDSVYTEGIDTVLLPTEQEIAMLLVAAESSRPQVSGVEERALCFWVRLVLPLRVNHRTVGLWLLGRRDPDNSYAPSEIPFFQAIADQTALALANIDQATQLRLLYQASIDRHEIERTHLARILHDEVLHQLAVLSMQIEETKTSPHYDEAYHVLTAKIRQLITGLRPAMMSYGLRAALEELGEDLAERAGDTVNVCINLSETSARYASRVEQHLFRIVQQACENALRHAQAKTISLTGQFNPGSVQITIKDDGVGFSIGNSLEINKLLADKHFGLVGMYERAAIIGADLRIETRPGNGTQIIVNWHAQEEFT